VRCSTADCCRRGEVVVYVDGLAAVACLTHGIRLAVERRGRIRLLGTAMEVAVIDLGRPTAS